MVRRFDYFGASPQFFIFGGRSHTSIFGSLLTFIGSIILIAVSFSFGKDFYYKQNPSVLYDNVIADVPTTKNLTPANFDIIFRIEDYNGIFINRTDLFNITVYHSSVVFNPITKVNEERQIVYSPSTCSGVITNERLESSKNLSEWYCLDYSQDSNIGGDWTYTFISYYTIVVNTNCENSECKYSEVMQFLTDITSYISIIYPTYYFSPSNYSNPLNVTFWNYYWSIKGNIAASDEIYFRNYIVNSDYGWFFESHEFVEVIAFDRIEKDFYLQTVSEDSGSNEYLYSVTFYWVSDYTQINRIYMKLQDVTALVGGFMQAIFTLGFCLASPYNSFSMYQKLISYILHEEVDVSEEAKPISDDYSKMKSPATFVKERPDIERDRIDPITTDQNASNLKLPIQQNNFIKSFSSLRRTISHRTLAAPLDISKKRVRISYFHYMLGKFKCLRNREYTAFKLSCAILERKIDLASFLNFNFQFENLKSVFLNYYQGISLSYFKKPNIKVHDELDYALSSLYTDIDNFSRKEELIKYFVSSITDNSMMREDVTIFENLNPEIRQEVFKNVNS